MTVFRILFTHRKNEYHKQTLLLHPSISDVVKIENTSLAFLQYVISLGKVIAIFCLKTSS